MTRTLRYLSLAVLAVALAVPALAQTTGRVQLKVVDSEGEPIAGATVTVTTDALSTYKEILETNKKGRVTLAVTDATFSYTFVIEKEGFQPTEVPIKPAVGGTTAETITMPRATETAAAPVRTEPVRDPAVLAYNAGVEAQTLGNLELAEAKFAEAAETNSKLCPAWAALGVVNLLQKDYEAALSAADRALELEPDNFQALNVRYDAYSALGESEKAAEAFRRLKELGSAADVAARVFNEAVEAFKAGQVNSAKQGFLRALDLDPELHQAYGALGTIALQEQSWSLAQEYAERLLAAQPDSLQGLRLRFDAARFAGDQAAADEALGRLAELDPDWVTNELYTHAVEQFNHGNYALAEPIFEQVLEIDSDHARAHYLLGMTSFHTGHQDRAKEHLQRFIELAPEDADAPVAREMLQYLS